MRYNLRIDWRNMWLSAPTAWRPWRLLVPWKQRSLWFISAKGHWMISPSGMRWAFFASLDMLEYQAMKSPMGSRGAALLWDSLDPRAVGVSRRDLQKRLGRWLVSQHWVQWWVLGDTQRHAREFISGPSLGTRAKFMTLSRIQSRVVTGLLTGHNTLRRHLHLLGLTNSPLCRWCETGEENSANVLCEGEALASRRHAHLGSFFLEPGDIKNLNLGAIWNYSKAARLPWFDIGHKVPVY